MNPQTIGDVITAQLAAVSSQSSAAAVAATADAALVTANTALAVANSQLAADLAAEGGPVFTVDDSGVVTVYITDTSPAGFHSFVPLPASTPLPVPPARRLRVRLPRPRRRRRADGVEVLVVIWMVVTSAVGTGVIVQSALGTAARLLRWVVRRT